MIASLAIDNLVATIAIGGSIVGTGLALLMLRGTAPKKPKRTVEEIVRTAPYENLDNILKIAKS